MAHYANDGGGWVNKRTPEKRTLNGLGAAARGAMAVGAAGRRGSTRQGSEKGVGAAGRRMGVSALHVGTGKAGSGAKGRSGTQGGSGRPVPILYVGPFLGSALRRHTRGSPVGRVPSCHCFTNATGGRIRRSMIRQQIQSIRITAPAA